MRAAYDDRPIHGSPGSYERGWARLLWWGTLGKFDALLNVSFKALDSNIKKLLLILASALKDVDGFLDAVRLFDCQYVLQELDMSIQILTPSSIGVEKKSTPVAFAISAPPGTPGR